MTRSFDSLTPEQRDHICPACSVRYKRRTSPVRDFGSWLISKNDYRWLEKAAEEFDAQSDELWTAREFVASLAFDVPGSRPAPPFTDGAPPRNLNGSVASMTGHPTAHRDPWPLPIATKGERHTRGTRRSA